MNATKQRFDGWKQIALHFSRSVRCVQRWERTEKLPMHRHSHARGSTVYAFLRELETWQSIDRARLGARRICKPSPTRRRYFS